MSRRILHLNVEEERRVAIISAALERERAAFNPPPKPTRQRPEAYVILNGRLYVPANDETRIRAERAFTGRGGRSRA